MASADAPTPDDDRTDQPPPLGSWARMYLLVAVLAIGVMFALWLIAATYNIRMPD
ncbi:MAG: hypothetical protein NXI31_20055 [bacterium]|nr:hypothetical protein [bacterium]